MKALTTISSKYQIVIPREVMNVVDATARAHDATLWTQDEHFKAIEGVEYIVKKG